jgi:nitrogen regulatory protein PII
MSEHFTPEVSEYRLGEILNVEFIGKLRKELTIRILSHITGRPKAKETWGFRPKEIFEDPKKKLEIVSEDEDAEVTEEIITVDFDALIDPRVI